MLEDFKWKLPSTINLLNWSKIYLVINVTKIGNSFKLAKLLIVLNEFLFQEVSTRFNIIIEPNSIEH